MAVTNNSHQTGSYLVVGGGLVGLATSRALLKLNPGAPLTVLEKESACGQHQSTHNSGVLHCGLHYKPGSLKARLAVEGIRAMVEFCQQHSISYELCGKIVLATNEHERIGLNTLEERGIANGLKGLRRMGPEEIAEREPYARGVEALFVPEEGIVDYQGVVHALRKEIIDLGGTVECGAHVRHLRYVDRTWLAETDAGEFRGSTLVNCAGLHSDRIARMAGLKPAVRIIPFRGEFSTLAPDAGVRINHLIYPVPHPSYPFLGVHFTRLIQGDIEAGPNAVLALAREGYSRWNMDPLEVASLIAFPGLWRFVARNPRLSLEEWMQTWIPALFVRALQRLVPEIRHTDLVRGRTGVRAQAMQANGKLEHDFVTMRTENALHVLNAPSPAATASLALGKHIATLAP